MDSGAVVSPACVARPFRLLPFRALMLSPDRIGDPASARAFSRPYDDVSARLLHWQYQGELERDGAEALYLHEYTVGGTTVRGLVGALDMSRRANSSGEVAVVPHEGVRPRQAGELADLMAEMLMNPAPILLVHRGSPQARELLAKVRSRLPDREFDDRSGQRHRVWAIRDEPELADLAAAIAPAQALIADGHHRYAAYLSLQRDLPGAASDAGLAMLVDQDDTPMSLGAIHRVLAGATIGDLADAARTAGFEVDVLDPVPADPAQAVVADTLVATDATTWATLRLTVPPGTAAVQVVHDLLVARLAPAPAAVTYHHLVEDAVAAVTERPGVAILMPALDYGLVVETARAGRLLPEKATYFQPKPSIGVLIRSLTDG